MATAPSVRFQRTRMLPLVGSALRDSAVHPKYGPKKTVPAKFKAGSSVQIAAVPHKVGRTGA